MGNTRSGGGLCVHGLHVRAAVRFASARVLLRVHVWLEKRDRRPSEPYNAIGNIFDIRSTVHFMVEKVRRQP